MPRRNTTRLRDFFLTCCSRVTTWFEPIDYSSSTWPITMPSAPPFLSLFPPPPLTHQRHSPNDYPISPRKIPVSHLSHSCPTSRTPRFFSVALHSNANPLGPGVSDRFRHLTSACNRKSPLRNVCLGCLGQDNRKESQQTSGSPRLIPSKVRL